MADAGLGTDGGYGGRRSQRGIAIEPRRAGDRRVTIRRHTGRMSGWPRWVGVRTVVVLGYAAGTVVTVLVGLLILGLYVPRGTCMDCGWVAAVGVGVYSV
jgi:hypothetical protein